MFPYTKITFGINSSYIQSGLKTISFGKKDPKRLYGQKQPPKKNIKKIQLVFFNEKKLCGVC